MPLLEAPQDLSESSPEISLNPEIPAAPGNVVLPIAPVAAAQIRLPTPQPRFHVEQEVLLQNQRNLQRNVPRLANFDPDEVEIEEENHFPAYVHLLPVVLPVQAPEPTLDELLRRVTSRTDLHNVESVRLRVISYSLSLSHLALFVPRLQQLDLSGSVLCTLRDLGYGLIHLSHLNVSNCGLNSFDGTSGFPALRSLVADDNMIQRIGSLTDLPLLQHLSVRHNRISELNTLTFLGMCPNLLELDLQGNPVCHQQAYRLTLQRNIPTLQVLDGIPMENMLVPQTTQGDQLSSLDSDEVSSLSSTSNSIRLETPHSMRPVTAPAAATNCDPLSNVGIPIPRPHSVSRTSCSGSLSSGSPVMGSVLALARQRQRRKRHQINAWASSDSSSYSTASSRNSSRPTSSISSGSSLDLSSMQATRKENK